MIQIRRPMHKAGIFMAAFAMAFSSVMAMPTPARAAACEPVGVDHGSVTSSVAIPETATYKIWSRLKTPKSDYNTYFLEIDGKECFWVGGPIAADQWTWIGTKDNSNAALTVSLAKGAHSLKLIGNDEGLMVDRVIFASDLNCIPTGNGSNCDNPSDTAPPTVKLTAPAANSTVSGQVNVAADASDSIGVKKVDFYLNSTLKNSDTSAPYGFTLNTLDLSDGDYQLIAKAYDAANNSATDSYKIVVKNTNIQVPPPPSNVAVSSPTYNSTTITWDPSPGASGYKVFRDGIPIAQVGPTATSYTDANLVANTQYSYQVAALHESGATSSPTSKVDVSTKTVDDTAAPSEVQGLTATPATSAQINLLWGASVDNIGVKFYDVYRGKGTESPQKIAQVTTTSFGDVGLQANTEYSYFVKARDANNNEGASSETVKAKTLVAQRRSVVYGAVRDQDASTGITGATAVLTKPDSTRVIYTTSRNGEYIFRRLEADRYTINYSATGYNSKASSLRLADEIVRKDVTLRKR
jgi:fibronectin type 3 domain-containing protein